MNVKKYTLYLYAETPMHVGTGVGLGAVDMPIQREKHTGYPIIQASGVKGALRDTAELELNKDIIKSIFGADSENREITHAGAMSPSDARILLFPVRALNGVFMWVTSPTVLARFKQETGIDAAPAIPEIGKDAPVQVSDEKLLVSKQIMLEEYTYSAEQTTIAVEWATWLAERVFPDARDYWHGRIKSHLVILPDDDFRDFVRYSTDIVTRIHIDDMKKTVKDGQLFTQELLPADSLLYSFVHITNSRDERASADEVAEVLKDAIGERIQIGGDETVGRGRVRLNWQETR